MRVRQPCMHWPHRHLYRKRGKKPKEQPELHAGTETMRGQHGDVGCTCLHIHGQHTDQHQHRTQQGKQEEFKRRINPSCTTPDTDDQKHRYQHRFEKQIEHQHIERNEHADHHCFKNQKGDHIFTHTMRDGTPTSQNSKRCQKC